MKPSRFSRFLTLFRDCAAIVAIVWAFLLFAFPDVQRLSDKTFGISAYYFMGEYRVCVKKTDAYVPPATGAPLEDSYCWIRFKNEERLCSEVSEDRTSCTSPIAGGNDAAEQWKTAAFVKDIGFQYGYELSDMRFYHYRWRLEANASEGMSNTSEKWGYEEASRAARKLTNVTGDLVYLATDNDSANKVQPGRERRASKPADAADTYANGKVLTIAKVNECLFVEDTFPTGALREKAEYPNNIYARMVKVSCL